MNNKKVLAVLAIAISASVSLSACSFFGKEEEEQVVVTETPTPKATETPTPTPTIAPDVQNTTYTSADKSVSIQLPDATWSNKTDETDTLSFESPDAGSILILHGQGEDALASTVFPSTQDMAVSLEQADGDKVNGTDFEIQDYTSSDVNGIGVYSYVTKMLNTEKSDGALYVVHKVFANSSEYYTIEASVKTEDALESIKTSVDSFAILGDSTLKEAAPGSAAAATTTTDTSSTDNTAGDTAADTTSTDTGSTDTSSTDTTTADSSTTITNSGGFTDEQLSNTDETRTIYDNSDGHPIVITPDGNGNWVDFDGKTYTFATEQDAYDADGNSYYWHGEGADVYYMPVN